MITAGGSSRLEELTVGDKGVLIDLRNDASPSVES